MSSPRRGGNDESILAMLERDGTRGLGRGPASPARLGWYVGGAVLAVCLVGTLIWLARDNTGLPPGEPVAQASPVEASPARSEGDGQHAAIIDEARPAPARQDEPPLVLLSPPAQSSAEEAPRPTHAAVVDEKVGVQKQAAVAEAAPKPVAAAAVIEQPATRHAAVAAAPVSRVAEPKRPASASQRPRAGKLAVAQHGKTLARPKKPAGTVQPVSAPVDSDVALISAVIQHSAKHNDGGCEAEAGCAAKATAQP
ncbi:hypothetical protein NX774_09055 [Massilia agilis]|uniref:Uncharacterized protein n=1 Tax=Massilia agilis TaxID=1811226 RepID=A0ABT2D9T1_9BURK|nr:hypothetical protein [Massilia agilis]MCS0808065.1 hypothetical protein [Massilia agilis]